MASEEMSREEKEALLNIRMEAIRKKNAELQKRYEEVKADKQNAEEISDSFKETHRNIREEPRAQRTPSRPVENAREKVRREVRAPQRTVPKEEEKKRPQRFTEDDGPPPDPSYSFLADRSREGNSSSAPDRRRDSRRHPGNFGGKDFDNVRSTMESRRGYDKSSPRQPPQNKMEMSMRMTGRERCEYEKWRSERSKIEHDRMDRQRTTSGEWKREWDREKQFSNEPEEADQSNRWSSQNRGNYRGGRRGRGRGPRQWSDHSQQRPYHDSPESDDAPPPQENRLHPRRIKIDKESINVRVSNERVAPTTGPRRAVDGRQSAGSREYSSSVSEDERPPQGLRSNMRWCDEAKSPEIKEAPCFEDAVFRNEELPLRGHKPQPQGPKVEQGTIEQRVTFVDNSIYKPRKSQPKVSGMQSGEGLTDDASSSVSDYEPPPPGLHSNMRWCDEAKSPECNEAPCFEDADFRNEQLPLRGHKLVDPPTHSTEAKQGVIEQRVIFVDNCIRDPHESQPTAAGLQSGEEPPDDASWDDEGSWEEATSGNESRELSQRSQEVPEISFPGIPSVAGSEAASDAVKKSAVSALLTVEMLQPDNLELAPVVEVQDAELRECVMVSEASSNVDNVQAEVADDDGQLDVFEDAAMDATELSQQSMESAELSQKSMESADLSQKSLKNAELSQKSLENPELSQKSLENAELSQKSMKTVEVLPQLSGALQQVTEAPMHPMEYQEQPEKSEQALEPYQQSTESSQQPTESFQQTREPSKQSAFSSQEHAELSSYPAESYQSTESVELQISAEVPQQLLGSSGRQSELQISEEEPAACLAQHEESEVMLVTSSPEARSDVLQIETDLDRAVEPTAIGDVTYAAVTDSATTGQCMGEAQPAQVATSDVTPVPCHEDVTDAEKCEQ